MAGSFGSGAVELGVGYISVVPDASGFQKEINKQLSGASGEASKAGEQAGRSMSDGMKKALKIGGAAVATAAVAGIAVAMKGGWDRALDIDNGRRVLSGLYGDAEKAGDMLDRIRRISQGSSIDTSSYIGAAESLAYIGVEGDQAERILENVGQAIVGTGGSGVELERVNGALSNMVNLGKVNREELIQLSNAGVPVFEGLAKHLGVTVEEMNKMVSDGAVSLDDVLSVMEHGTGDYFDLVKASADEVEQGIGATWRRLKDNLADTIGFGMEGSSFFDGLAPALEVAGNAVVGLIDGMKSLGEWIQRNEAWITPLAVAIGAAAAVFTVWHGAILAWTAATKVAAAVQAIFNKVVAANKIMLIVMAIAALVSGLVYFFTQTEVGQRIWQAFTDAIATGWEWVKNAFATAWDFIQPILQGIWDVLLTIGQIVIAVFAMPFVLAWQMISEAVMWAWNTIIKPTWDLMQLGLQLLGEFFIWVWTAVIQPAWNALGAGIQWVWATIIQPAWEALKAALGVVGTVFQYIYSAVIYPVWLALGNTITFVWNTVIKPAWDALKAALGAVGSFFQWVWNSVIKPAWDALGNGIRAVWTGVISPAFEALKSGLDSVRSFFSTAVEGIRSAWDALKGHVARPINFVIETVWNNGLVRAWETIQRFLPGLPDAQRLAPVAFATGGAVSGPGTGTSDSILARLSHGEHVLTAAEVKALGGQQQVYAMREMIRSGVWPMGHGPDMMPKFRDGGEVGTGVRLGPTPGEGGLQPIAILAKRLIHRIWPSIGTIGGYRGEDGYGEHSSGRALDVMVGVGNPIGDEVTSWALANHPIIPMIHAIWKQQMWYPGQDGGTMMGDRGNPTQNHMDHPHLWYQNVPMNPNVVPEGLVGHDGLTREDRLGVIKDKINEIIDKMMDPLIDGLSGAIGSPPPEWLGIPPKVATKSKDGAVDAAFDFVEKIGDDLRDVYNAARDVKNIVVSRITGLWRDEGGYIPPGQSVVTNETGKPEAVLNWEQLEQVTRLVETASGLAALEAWAHGDPSKVLAEGLSEEIVEAVEETGQQIAEGMVELGKSLEATFHESFQQGVKDDVLGFFGLSGLVGGFEKLWADLQPSDKSAGATAGTAGATVSRAAGAATHGNPNLRIEDSEVELETKMPALGGEPGTGPVADQVREAMSVHGWDSGAQWEAINFIVTKESTWNPTAQNPTSTAYGLFQFLDTTWAGTGISKTDNPKLQAEAAAKYIKDRYGDPVGARRFWEANGWYDQGGWLMPGVNLTRNDTRKPEPVLNHAQWDAITKQTEAVAGIAAGGGAPMVHIENLHARDEDAAFRAATREARRATRSNSLVGGWV